MLFAPGDWNWDLLSVSMKLCFVMCFKRMNPKMKYVINQNPTFSDSNCPNLGRHPPSMDFFTASRLSGSPSCWKSPELANCYTRCHDTSSHVDIEIPCNTDLPGVFQV